MEDKSSVVTNSSKNHKNHKMNKQIFILSLILLAIFTGGCSKTPINPEEPLVVEPPVTPVDSSWHTWEIPSRSHVIRYISNILNMKCPDTLIKIREEDFYEMDEYTMDSIYGTWQLLFDFNEEDTIDYSCNSVLYSFDHDSTVIISSDVKEISGGIFIYDYYSDPYCRFCLPTIDVRANFVIGENKSFCQLARSWLITDEYSEGVDSEGVAFTNRGDARQIFRRIK